MKRIITLCLLSLMFSVPTLAADLPDFDKMTYEERREAMEKMSPEEREAFHKARKEQWDAMSDSEKLQLIEQKRTEMRAARDARWSAMSDAEKIKYAEEKMEKYRHYGEKKEGCCPMKKKMKDH